MKYLFLIVVTLIFIGCSNTIPPKVEYRINSQIQGEPFAQSGCIDKSLKIARAFSSNTLRSQDMSYRVGDSKQYTYSEALWSVTPNKAVTFEFLSLVRDSQLFKSVQTSKSRSSSDIILELNIEDFMQYFNDDSTSSYVNTVINLSLINVQTNTVFATQTFRKKVVVNELNSNAGVNALNIALQEILKESSIWLGRICK